MAEETPKTASDTTPSTEVVDVPEAEKPDTTATTTEKVAEAEVPEQPVAGEEAVEGSVEQKIGESASFEEETNVVGELPDPQKVALDELKQLVQDALNNHGFTAPPPPPPEQATEVEKLAEPLTEQVTEEVKSEEVVPVTVEPPKTEPEEVVPPKSEPFEPVMEEVKSEEVVPVTVEPQKTEPEEVVPPKSETVEPVVVVADFVEKVVDDDGAKTVEAIEETIVAAAAPAPPPEEPVQSETAAEAEPAVTVSPEEVSIWGIPLLVDERSDVILLKFLRARDFKVKEAFVMLKSVVAWRKEFGIDALVEEDLGHELDKVVFMDGFDKEGHPVCYNAFGEFQNKELYHKCFGDEEKRTKFLRWRVQFLEKSIRKLDFSPDGINTIVQVNDLKNSPIFLKKELISSQAVSLFQDNYPEFVAKQVFLNVPWWYLALYKMISSFFTARTKSKFVMAGPTKSAEILFKYIAPEQVPVQYGGLSREGEQEFSTTEPAIEEIIKPSSKHIIELLVSDATVLVWEAQVVGGEVSYGAEFVPVEGYTIIIQKPRKLGPGDEPIIADNYKPTEAGKVVLTFDNQNSKKKKLFYRSKTKPTECT